MNSNIRCSFSLSDNIGPGPAAYLPQIPKSGVAFSMLHRPVNKKGILNLTLRLSELCDDPKPCFPSWLIFSTFIKSMLNHNDAFAPLTETTLTKCVSSLVFFFQNEDIFVQLDELGELDRIIYA